MSKDIWVYAETVDGRLSETVPELLTKAVELSGKLGGRVAAVLTGSAGAEVEKTLSDYGAQAVIIAESEALASYSAGNYADALTQLCRKYEPSIFLFPAGPIGYEVAPLVMCALGTGLTADAIDLFVDEDGDFIQTTPGFGGSILAHICIGEKRPQMVTVRPKVFEPRLAAGKPAAERIVEPVSCEPDTAYELLEVLKGQGAGAGLKDARVVVACGRGVKKQEDLELMRRFADRIGGVLACSRPLVDCGWLPHELQIGQSGCTVKADVIINIGISGSTQYLAGMQNSKCIISINTNESAPIMAASHYSLAADYRKLIPALLAKLGG